MQNRNELIENRVPPSDENILKNTLQIKSLQFFLTAAIGVLCHHISKSHFLAPISRCRFLIHLFDVSRKYSGLEIAWTRSQQYVIWVPVKAETNLHVIFSI